MRTIVCSLLSAVVLLVGRVCLADDADDEQKKAVDAAREAVLTLASNLEAKDHARQIERVAREHRQDALAAGFKLRSKGGIGIGKLVEVGHPDSIERLICDYAVKTPTESEVTKY